MTEISVVGPGDGEPVLTPSTDLAPPGMTTTTAATVAMAVDGVGPVAVTVTERGQGHPFLLLHGGGGPQTVSGFADLLAETEHARVITPTHPGFDRTPRPEALNTVRGLAALYIALLEQLGLTNVTVVGNSIGGWITAEMALIGSARISSVILVDAVGINVPGHPVADFFALTMDRVVELSFHDPDSFRVDPLAMPAAQQEAMAGNRAALAAYDETPSMTDLTLRGRLKAMSLPALVLWGDSDQIADPDYGRAYADAIPAARFQLLTATGHLPQIETPQQLLAPVLAFARSHATNHPVR
jgi:pimeloyl-ACP methyl ester carboxylesterase